MTEEQRKLLTEDVLGECWHEWTDDYGLQNYTCRECGKASFDKYQDHTFNTGNDLLALKEALVKKGLWDDFYWFADNTYWDGEDGVMRSEPREAMWLIDKDRFPKLVAEFMEVEK